MTNAFQLLIRFLIFRYLNILLQIVLHVGQNRNIWDKNVVEQINKIIKCEKAINISQLSRSSHSYISENVFMFKIAFDRFLSPLRSVNRLTALSFWGLHVLYCVLLARLHFSSYGPCKMSQSSCYHFIVISFVPGVQILAQRNILQSLLAIIFSLCHPCLSSAA